MHDVGKIGIPDAILRKPGKLTPAEFETMKTHTLIGARMLEGSQSAILAMARDIALCHHERWDGTGYPQGLSGLAIPEPARILSIVDVYDALSHDRVYRPALPEDEVLNHLAQGPERSLTRPCWPCSLRTTRPCAASPKRTPTRRRQIRRVFASRGHAAKPADAIAGTGRGRCRRIRESRLKHGRFRSRIRRGVYEVSASITYIRRTRDGLVTTSNRRGTVSRLERAGRVLDVRLAARRRRRDRRRPDVSGRLGRRGQVHAVVVTDGRMGYCRFEQRRNITKIRRAEAEKSYQILGLPPGRLRFIECPDCNLNAYRGRHFTTIGAPTEIEGAGGMQNAITYALRQVRPNRVFLPTSADLHPDHQIVHEEVLISLFHAQGNIWPELGPPIAEVPKVYEFAVLLRFSRAAADPHRNAARDARNQAPGDSWPIASQEQIEHGRGRSSATPGRSSISASWSSISTRPQQYHALFTRTS